MYQSTSALVMSPGVHVERLQDLARESAPPACPAHCGFPLPSHTRHFFTPRDRLRPRCGTCFTVGIACRLSQEKSIGLFLLAAAEMVHTFRCERCRFVVAAEGKARRDWRL